MDTRPDWMDASGLTRTYSELSGLRWSRVAMKRQRTLVSPIAVCQDPPRDEYSDGESWTLEGHGRHPEPPRALRSGTRLHREAHPGERRRYLTRRHDTTDGVSVARSSRDDLSGHRTAKIVETDVARCA
jgi:hypothetical protein